MDNYEELRQEFKQLRRERGISSKDIIGAKDGGKVYAYESSKRIPRLNTFINWLNTMGLKLKIVKK